MRGLKHVHGVQTLHTRGRIFYRCVDWNIHIKKSINIITVASFTDAWIETGLSVTPSDIERVASFTDAWIETTCVFWASVRRICRIFYRCVDWNLPLRIKGLLRVVASFTDAWIETGLYVSVIKRGASRIFYRCVDWNKDKGLHDPTLTSRIFYRCVDWNWRYFER